MSSDIPSFAIVGAVNHGKSSVVSTLAENDQVRISSMPGETVAAQKFWLLDLFVFYDTPGFQNALEALPELIPAAQAREPLAVFRAFTANHRGQPEFESECLLFAPILEGAGIVYVVDGSEPVLEIHGAEMEILRLTGQPRLAIINRTSSDDHVAEWKRRLGLHFNAVREFNAHAATFADRLELLETLAGIEQSWKPKLSRAVAIFREEWSRRLEECAEIVVELLCDALTHREVGGGDLELKSRRDAAAETLRKRFTTALRERELQAHRAIITLFGHSRVAPEAESGFQWASDLFSEDTWRAFGLSEGQLVAAGAVGGAAAGAALDLVTVGHTLGLPTVLGAGFGALAALVVGKRQPEIKVEIPWLPGDVRLSGSAISVGPYAALNFPWVLLDRGFGVFFYVVHRAHARRDAAVIESAAMKTAMESAGLTCARWDDAARRSCERLFAKIRRGKLRREDRAVLRDLIARRLAEISAAKVTSSRKTGRMGT